MQEVKYVGLIYRGKRGKHFAPVKLSQFKATGKLTLILLDTKPRTEGV